jgi:hypothetical protein
MHDHDPTDEPCFLDYSDDPDFFEGKCERPAPPAGMTWWEGWWPTGGVNSIADLEWWVALRLEQMISLQGCDTLADIGRMLGIQALKNADRYLGQFGKGDHPRRPTADDLQQVEAVEDALENVLRYLRQQAQPTGGSEPEATPQEEQEPALQSWTQPKLDAAIREYIAARAGALKSLTEAIQGKRPGAVESARKMFGRNEIARALRVKSRTMVTKSEAWIEIADDLHLRPDELRGIRRKAKIGFDIAVERKAQSQEDPVLDELEKREAIANIGGEFTEQEAIAFVHKHLTGYEAEAIITSIKQGQTPPERVFGMVNILLKDREDTGHRRRR